AGCFANGRATPAERDAAHTRAQAALDRFPPPDAAWHALPVPEQDCLERARNACWAVVDVTREDAFEAADHASVAAASAAGWVARLACGPTVLGASRDKAADNGYDLEREMQAGILKELVGNPLSAER